MTAAAKEVCTNDPYSEPGKPESQNPGGGDLQLSIIRRQSAPVAVAHYSGLAQGGEGLRISVNNPTPFSPPLIPFAAELPLQIDLLLAGPRDPGDPARQGLTFLDPGHEIVAEKGYVGVDSDEVLAKIRENRHGENGFGGEIKEMEPVCVHDVAEEIGKGRAKPAIEEQGEEVVSFWTPLRSRSFGGERLRARMRPHLRRPEEIELLPQRLRGELGGKKCSLLAQRLKPQRLG